VSETMTREEEEQIGELANQISDLIEESDCNPAQQLMALAVAASLLLTEQWPSRTRPAAVELFRLTIRENMEGEPDNSLN
jgi:hypothetical protein